MAKYGEDNIKQVEKMRAESEICLQKMTNEIVEEPEAANAAPDEDLYLNYNEDYPMMEHSPEIQAHFDQLFATLAADPETKARMEAKAKEDEAYAICMNKICNELETEAKTAAKIKAFDIQKEADNEFFNEIKPKRNQPELLINFNTEDPETKARIVADRKARKDAKQARKASKIAAAAAQENL